MAARVGNSTDSRSRSRTAVKPQRPLIGVPDVIDALNDAAASGQLRLADGGQMRVFSSGSLGWNVNAHLVIGGQDYQFGGNITLWHSKPGLANDIPAMRS